MTHQYFLFPFDSAKVVRLVFAMITAGVFTVFYGSKSFFLFRSPANSQTQHFNVKETNALSLTNNEFRTHARHWVKAEAQLVGPGALLEEAPAITGQVPVSTAEDQSVSLELAHLVITDPDSESFTLSILGGPNYNVSGSVITPVSDFNGILTVRLFVSDGTANSNIFDFQITVDPVNDPPVITGQRQLTTLEDLPIVLSLADVTVSDPDNTFPDGFALTVMAGEHYTLAGTTVTPASDYTGTLSVGVAVSDGAANSEPFSLQIPVTAVNDAPEITGQQAVSTNEEEARTIVLADLIVTDPDNPFPTGFSLTVFPGDNYTLTGNTILPVVDFSGPLTVPVQVSDGTQTSNIFELQVQVVAVNDKPVISGQLPVETPEDTPVTVQLSHLTVFDPDNNYPVGFILTVAPGTNYTVSEATVQPALDFNGTLNVSITVSDGLESSEPFMFQIQVGNANDAPVITGQTPLVTNEEQPVALTLAHLTVVDPDNVFPKGFSLLVSPGTNYTVTGETVTPDLNFSGVLTVPVRVSDGVNNSPTFNFQLQVAPINDAPFFDAIPNQQVAENTPAGSVTITGISKGPMEDDQQLTFVATSSNTAIIENPVIQYGGMAATANLSFVIKPNQSGIVTLTIVAIDNGSNVAPNVNSYTGSFQVEVVEINSAPTLNAIADITIMEDAEQQNIPLTGISAGEGETQTLTVTLTADKPQFFDLLEVDYTSPGATGSVRFKTKPDVSGTTRVSVTVTDSGPSQPPHVNSITQSFSLKIEAVNDPPVFTSQPVTIAVAREDYEYIVTVSDPDGEKINFSAPTKPAWLSLASQNNGSARLHGRPPESALGNFNVTLEAKDGKSTISQSFVIYVNVRPSIESLNAATEEDIPVTLSADFFQGGYSDMNENALRHIVISSLPESGVLFLGNAAVKQGDSIQSSALSSLQYHPNENFSGTDAFSWNAYDGYHYS
ncbi:MAG: tandem-95 repeat protein, partial [Bacteroidota bacterium]|nr:tandem-95 repeat protein [Bacteroidota bacterium]